MRILIIEDEKKIADSIKKGLEQETYACDVSYDGEDGHYMASSENYDLIILDLMLPGMDGMEICQSLRAEKIDIPILMLTAKSEVEDKVDGLNCGADDYLSKPFAFTELLARMKALLRRPQKNTGTILKCSDVKIDTNNYEVKRSDRQIDLSKKEYALLEYLIRNKNQVLSKEQIIEHVWDFDSDVLPNTVEQYIGYLRQKLGKPDLIKTIRGFGYILKCSNQQE